MLFCFWQFFFCLRERAEREYQIYKQKYRVQNLGVKDMYFGVFCYLLIVINICRTNRVVEKMFVYIWCINVNLYGVGK